MYDPYSVLGISRSASEDEIKHAFRRLAKRFHPDTAEGASDKGRRFKDLSIAYEILGDAQKRRAYDRGEIDAHGNPRAGYKPRPEPEPASDADDAAARETSFAETDFRTSRRAQPQGAAGDTRADGARSDRASTAFRSAFERAFGTGTPPPRNGGSAGSSGTNGAYGTTGRVEDLFSEFFVERNGAGTSGTTGSDGVRRDPPAGNAVNALDLSITFEEAALGGTRRIKTPGGKRFDVRIPAGARDGQVIRVPGQGDPLLPGDANGDAVITILIEPHPYFRRAGNDVQLELPVTLGEALHGAKIKVPTLHGTVTMAVPAGANTGQVLRLKGKGIPAHGAYAAGDQLVVLQVVLPEEPDANLNDLVKRWEAAHPYDPRRKFGAS